MKKILVALVFACTTIGVFAEDDIFAIPNPRCHLCRGSGKMMGKTTCKCVKEQLRKSNIVAIPTNCISTLVRKKCINTLVRNGIFGLKFGESCSNKFCTLSRPWRNKYTTLELKTNSAGKLKTVRVIWFFENGCPPFGVLYDEVSDLCKIFKLKYGFDIKCNPGSYHNSRLSSLDTYYNDASWYVGISCRDGDRLFFDVSCKNIPEYERISTENIQGIDDI